MGSRVLAKQRNKLWHRSVILKAPDDKNDEYEVKFEASGNVAEVPIDDILPLGNYKFFEYIKYNNANNSIRTRL